MGRLFKKRWVKVVITTILVIALPVILFNIFNNGKDIRNSQDLINALKSKGYKVENIDIPKSEETKRPFKWEWFEPYYNQRGAIKVDDISIAYFEFETEEQAKAASETISKDGSKIGRAHVDWITAVKFYRKGNIIVNYGGTDFRMLWHLRTIMGKSIASSPLDYLLYKKFFSKS